MKKKSCYVFFLLITIIACSCNGNKTGTGNATDEIVQKGTPATDSFKVIYLWGSKTAWPSSTPFPIDSLSIDHAFATDYNPITGACPIDSNYWYCLGGGHPSNAAPTQDPANSCYYQHDTATIYAQSIGNVNFATQLISPNSVNRSNCPDDFGNATGGLPYPYAAFGVCHQIANRAAYATYWKGPGVFGSPVSLPKSLPGYRYSHFLYGTYGLAVAVNFKNRIDSLGGNSSFIGDNGDSLEKAWLAEDFGQKFADSIWNDFQLSRQLIQASVSIYVIETTKNPCSQDEKNAAQVALLINKKIAQLINSKLLPVLGRNGKEKYARMFGFLPGKELGLVDASHIRKKI